MNIPSFLSKIQLTQCYHCFEWCHKRNECPNIRDPVICSHCAGSGHSYLDCREPLKCTNCEQPHAATYKGCPYHQTALNTTLNEIQNHYNSNNNSASTPQSNDFDNNNIIRAARLASNSPQEFANELFAAATILVSPPKSNQTNDNITDPIPTRLTYDVDNEEISDNELETEHEQIPDTSDALTPPTDNYQPMIGQTIQNNTDLLNKDIASNIIVTPQGPEPYNEHNKYMSKPFVMTMSYNGTITDTAIRIFFNNITGTMYINGVNPDRSNYHIILDLGQLAINDSKQNELIITCTATWQLYCIKAIKTAEGYDNSIEKMLLDKRNKDHQSNKKLTECIQKEMDNTKANKDRIPPKLNFLQKGLPKI